MGIVRFALRFPHTFYVLAALIVFLGVVAIRAMPTDIFPEIRIPVVTVIWSYTGLSTPEMEQRVTTYSQYSISSNVNGIKNMEAQTFERPVGPEDLFPAGRQSRPRHRADRLGDQRNPRAHAAGHPAAGHRAIQRFQRSGPADQPELRHVSTSSSCTTTASIGCASSWHRSPASRCRRRPAGSTGRSWSISTRRSSLAKGLTPLDVVNAVNAQNLTLPSGTAKIGDTQYTVRTNATPATHRRAQQYSDQGRERRHGVREGRRPGPRRLAGAAERRPRGRPALGAAEHHQERQCVDARCRQRGPGGAEDRARGGACRPRDQ